MAGLKSVGGQGNNRKHTPHLTQMWVPVRAKNSVLGGHMGLIFPDMPKLVLLIKFRLALKVSSEIGLRTPSATSFVYLARICQSNLVKHTVLYVYAEKRQNQMLKIYCMRCYFGLLNPQASWWTSDIDWHAYILYKIINGEFHKYAILIDSCANKIILTMWRNASSFYINLRYWWSSLWSLKTNWKITYFFLLASFHLTVNTRFATYLCQREINQIQA